MAAFAWKHSATQQEMTKALIDIRKSLWRWDYAMTSHGTAPHAPQECMRLLSDTMMYAKDAQLECQKIAGLHGWMGNIPLSSISTRENAAKYIGQDMKSLCKQKQDFIDTVVPRWIKEMKKNKQFISQPV